MSLTTHVLARFLCLLWVSTLLSCGGPSASVKPQHGTLTRIPVPPDGPVLVVAPFDVPKSWTGVETYKRAVQLVEALSADGWPVLAPWEYQVFLASSDADVLKRSDAAQKWEALGARKSQIWVLTVSVREASSSLQTDVKAATARQHERTLNVNLTLEDPRLGEVLGEVSSSMAQDPFNEDADDVDALPALSEALPAIVRALTDVMAEQGVVLDATKRSNADLQPSYLTLETYAQEGQRSLRDRMATVDNISRLALSMVHYQFFEPMIALETIEHWLELPVGVKVVTPANLADLDIKAGDYLLSVEGVPFDGRHTVERLFRVEPQGGRRIVVNRAGKPVILKSER